MAFIPVTKANGCGVQLVPTAALTAGASLDRCRCPGLVTTGQALDADTVGKVPVGQQPAVRPGCEPGGSDSQPQWNPASALQSLWRTAGAPADLF